MSRQVASEGARAWQPAKKPIRLQPDDEPVDRSGHPCSSALFCPSQSTQGEMVMRTDGGQNLGRQGRIRFKRESFRILVGAVF